MSKGDYGCIKPSAASGWDARTQQQSVGHPTPAMDAVDEPLRQTKRGRGRRGEGERRKGDGESVAGADPLSDLIRAPGHSTAEPQTHTHARTHTLKRCLLAVTPCQSWPWGRSQTFLCSLLPNTWRADASCSASLPQDPRSRSLSEQAA